MVLRRCGECGWAMLCYAVRAIDAAKLGETDKETAGFVWGAGDVTHLGFVCAPASHRRPLLSCHRCGFPSWSCLLRCCPLGAHGVRRAREMPTLQHHV
ncbi:hypothetical protein IG631_02054 [Alternaria alternata]|nr:hypothetical protein IG631_02054 [Alternaria alternata]